MHPMSSPRFFAAVALLAIILPTAACQTDAPARSDGEASTDEKELGPGDLADLPDQPEAGASPTFWDHWGDGKAELASYTGEISRYGELRDATSVLIYVTEPHDDRTWVKDGDAPDAHRIQVLKLNRVLKFQTGIYPYSLMTSVFAPVADWDRPRFQPTKITFTSQEWCGHVFHGIWPGPERFLLQNRSYFPEQGDSRTIVETEGETLYQDALPIQLRELDGTFNGGKNWSGHIVPGLWYGRKGHSNPEPVEATITRDDAEVDGTPVTRFVLEYGGDTKVTYDVAKEWPHRLVRWKHSDGSHLSLKKSIRLPYWKLNRPGDETYRKDLGLEPTIRGGDAEDAENR